MKAGILTFHGANNYGAVLQAYALQKTLTALGIDNEFIDFCQTPPEERGPAAAAGQRGPAVFAARIRTEGQKRSALFDAFRRTYLRTSAPFRIEDAGKLNDLYDAFIAGSDQIWNAQLPEADGRYLLPFAAPEKRIAYAASFGTSDVPERLKDWYGRQLAAFHALSVREAQGRDMIKELTGRSCEVCLDPVLLLDRAEWAQLTQPYDGKPYLFLYMVNYDGQLAGQARKVAEQSGLELRIAAAGYIPQYGFAPWSGIGVEQWLSLIRNAEGVFTNSFHCTALSMVFGRPLSTALLREELSHRNGRLEELLALAGMDRRADGELLSVSAEAFAGRLESGKQRSLDYLKRALLEKSGC